MIMCVCVGGRGTDARITLKWIVTKYDGREGIAFI